MYADSSGGVIKRSRDHGDTWDTICPVGVDRNGRSFWLDGGAGFVAGFKGVLAKTNNGGVTWETCTFAKIRGRFEEYRVTDVYFATPEIGWIGGQFWRGPTWTWERNFFMKTNDGGRTWVDQSPAPLFCPEVMSFYDERRGWVYGFGGTFYTADGGRTWRRLEPHREVKDIAATGPKEAWATGGFNTLLRTVDGVSWKMVDPRVPGYYSSVEFPNNKFGYAAGSILIATVDGGSSWREVRNAPQGYVRVLGFPGKDRGVLGLYGGIYRTDDGGATFADITENVEFEAENVIGERRGCELPEEIVIICGHFDSVSWNSSLWDAPGAEDNASGTACAVAAARAFRNMSFKRTVRYVAFGGEEGGLLGSKAYADYCARKGEKIIAVLNADMVCYDEDAGARDDFVAGGGYNGRRMYAYLAAVGGLYGQKIIYEDLGHTVSDGRSFEDVGYPALGVTEGGKGSGGTIEYPYYHSAEDTLVGDHLFEPEPPGKAVTPFSRPFAVYPNPYCYATSAGGVNFVGIKAPGTVEIYDLAGRRVAREVVAAGSDECVWRPATTEGETLAPGVYLYQVEGQKQKKAGKIVVAR
jgi:photosystem II stability/assembly factor-like uncharacterized protein